MAVRTALGVTRGRLVRQLLTESGCLAAAGGLVGLALAAIAIRLVAANGPSHLPRLASVGMDARVVAMTLAITTLCALAFGLAPLRVLLRGDAARTMRGSGRRTDSGATWGVRATLVGVNVALAALLLVGAGLLVRSMIRLLAVPPGLDPAGVMTLQIWASGDAFRAGDTARQIATAAGFYEAVLTRVRALPGVTAASAVTTLPLGGGRDGIGLHVDGRVERNPESAPSADRFGVLPDYFAATGTPLLRGRLLGADDRQHTERVAVINRKLAAELFPGEEPLGLRLRLGPPSAEPRTIVGIVGDVRHHGLDVPAGYQVYVPHAQWAWAETFMTLVVRAPGAPTAVAGPVRDIVRAIDPAQPVTRVQRYSTIVEDTMSTRRFATTLLLAFAGTAGLLASVGLAGALGVLVRQRQREIGVRLALGAPPRTIAALIARQGLRPALIGLTAGLAGAALSATALDTLLYGVRALDPATFAAAAALLLGCLLLSCLLPASRAARIDPACTLRAE
jgi:putative ABC transport system permease protein